MPVDSSPLGCWSYMRRRQADLQMYLAIQIPRGGEWEAICGAWEGARRQPAVEGNGNVGKLRMMMVRTEASGRGTQLLVSWEGTTLPNDEADIM